MANTTHLVAVDSNGRPSVRPRLIWCDGQWRMPAPQNQKTGIKAHHRKQCDSKLHNNWKRYLWLSLLRDLMAKRIPPTIFFLKIGNHEANEMKRNLTTER